MDDFTLIANSGIHMTTFPLEIDTRGGKNMAGAQKAKPENMLFHEWYDVLEGNWMMELAHRVEDNVYKKLDLVKNGFLTELTKEGDISIKSLRDEKIMPLMEGDNMANGNRGEVYEMGFTKKECTLAEFENRWLPAPYFFRRPNEKQFKFGALNWSRFKLVPLKEREDGTAVEDGVKRYQVILAFDTRTTEKDNHYAECPNIPDQFNKEAYYELCSDEFLLMDYCSPKPELEYINNYLFRLAHPDKPNVDELKIERRLSYVATYCLLIKHIAKNNMFPRVRLYKDKDVVPKNVDMVIDIGNSQTTAILIEESNFNNATPLELVDYTRLVQRDWKNNFELAKSDDPFDMRLAMRRVDFGEFGIEGSRQFSHPSFVRLGKEAHHLIHRATEEDNDKETLSTLSSPKRYLWDGKKSKEEWRFMVLEGEKDSHVLQIPGISEHLDSLGRLVKDTSKRGGTYHYYSRRSMMTFAFLEMLAQAQTQINGEDYRTRFGDKFMPRRIKRMVVTCPTAMSKEERQALVNCASEAATLLSRFKGITDEKEKIEIIPLPPSPRDTESKWYYDEASCAQLVYMYGEVGYKYKGDCEAFFKLYGKPAPKGGSPKLTVASLDIGAGTTDLMISRYNYIKEDTTTLVPSPLFYDSYYYAGDDMVEEMVKNVMLISPSSAFRKQMSEVSDEEYRQKLRDFFGPDHAGQSMADRKLRRDFNLQYTIPLMYHFLQLLSDNKDNCMITFEEVFGDDKPNESVATGFEKFFGFRLEDLEWEFDRDFAAGVVMRAFEPLLKKIATIMHAHHCDIVLLSGRPASLPPIRDIFLKYYSVSPNRLILLNNYYVGHWYPFGQNSGYIKNPKTIVAMGALISYYGSKLRNLDRFAIDCSELDQNLQSIVNYIDATREGEKLEYILTPEQSEGQIKVFSLPMALHVRQLGIDSYPGRKLYVVDFDRRKIAENLFNQNMGLTDTQLDKQTKEYVDSLKLLMPFTITLSREAENKEQLKIEDVIGKEVNDKLKNKIDVNIQSLGLSESYWLDTGIFDIM